MIYSCYYNKKDGVNMNNNEELNKAENNNQNSNIQEQSISNNLNSDKRKINYKTIVIFAVIAIILVVGVSSAIIINENNKNEKMINRNNGFRIPKSKNSDEEDDDIDNTINEEVNDKSDEKENEEMPTTNKKTKDDTIKADEEKEKKLLEEINNRVGISFSLINLFGDVYFNKEYNISKINQSVRVALVSRYVQGEKNYSRTEKDNFASYSVASKSRIEESYEKAYGEKITITEKSYEIKYPIEEMNEGIMTGTWLRCPFFSKIEGDDIYFSHNCGGSSASTLKKLFYDYKEKDDTIEVYVATTIVTESSKRSYSTVSMGSINSKEVYDYFPKDEEFHLNEKNKDKFTNFKLTFTKNEQGNYIFTKSELI